MLQVNNPQLIGILILVLDLIITGIVGLVKGEIYAKRTFVGLFFIPLGLVGKLVGAIYKSADNEIDKGNAAISSSIAVIALGLFILIFFGSYYSYTYKILDENAINLLVPASLVFLIISIPSAILFFHLGKRKN